LKFFFVCISEVIKKGTLNEKFFFKETKLTNSKFLFDFKKAYFFFFENISFRNLGFVPENQFVLKKTGGRERKLSFNYNSSISKKGDFSQIFNDVRKFYSFTTFLIESLPGKEKFLIFKKFKNISFSKIDREKKIFILFSKNIFFQTSCFFLKIIKKSVKIKTLFSRFFHFLFHFGTQLFFNSKTSNFEFIHCFGKNIMQKNSNTKKNSFGYFFFQFFPKNFYYLEKIGKKIQGAIPFFFLF